MKRVKWLAIPNKRVANESKENEIELSHLEFDQDTYNIYFNGNIVEDDGIIFETIIDEMKNREGDFEVLNIHLNSYGGSLTATLSIMAQIEELQSEGIIVNGYAKTKCMSGACMILLCCTNRYARKYSRIMYHSPLLTSEEYLSIVDLKDLIKLIEDDWVHMKKQLLEKTKLTEKRINQIFKNAEDFTMTVEEAIEYGFVDEMM